MVVDLTTQLQRGDMGGSVAVRFQVRRVMPQRRIALDAKAAFGTIAAGRPRVLKEAGGIQVRWVAQSC